MSFFVPIIHGFTVRILALGHRKASAIANGTYPRQKLDTAQLSRPENSCSSYQYVTNFGANVLYSAPVKTLASDASITENAASIQKIKPPPKPYRTSVGQHPFKHPRPWLQANMTMELLVRAFHHMLKVSSGGQVMPVCWACPWKHEWPVLRI